MRFCRQDRSKHPLVHVFRWFWIWAVGCLGFGQLVAADVQINQFQDNPDPAIRGGVITYTLNVENSDVDTAHNVVLSMPLPATTTFVSATGGGTYSAGTVTWNLGDLLGTQAAPAGSTHTVTVSIRTTGITGNTLSATATISTTDSDALPSNNALTQNTTINNGADLQLTTAGSPDPIISGGNVTFTVDVTNLGPNDTAGTLTVTNTLPANTTWVSNTGSGWSFSRSGQVVTCTRSAALVSGDSAPTISIVAQVAAASGTITNLATTSAVTGDPDPNNNTATASVQVTPGADLALTKTVSGSAISQQNVTFILSPRNNGTSAASTVTVTDTLPAGFTFVSASGTGWTCGAIGQTVTCTRASYAVGATDNITIVATAPEALTPAPYTNTATISATTPDAVSSNNTGSASFNLMPDGADLSIAKTKSPNPVAQGAAMASTLTVHNAGPRQAGANTIIVTERLEDVLESYVSFTGTGWTYSGASSSGGYTTHTFTYTLALNSGANANALSISSTAVGTGAITNQATVAYSGTPGDWDLSNNATTASVTATATAISPDLSITKTASTPGGDTQLSNNETTIVYNLQVTNLGPGGATGVVVTDALPAHLGGQVDGVQTVSSASATFSIHESSGTVTITQTGGVFAEGETISFDIHADRPLLDGMFTNTATVRSTTLGDPNPTNNTASADVTIDPIADVQMVSKTVSPDPVQAGTEATYVISVRNNGPSSAQNVTVADVFSLPGGDTGFTLISVTPSKGGWSGLTVGQKYTGTPSLTASMGTLASGESQTLTVVVRPNWQSGTLPRTFSNTATISTDSWENTSHTDNGNNAATATLTVTSAAVDAMVNLTDGGTGLGPDPLGYDPGTASNNIVTYKVTATNNGPSLASGLTFDYAMTAPTGRTIRFLGAGATAAGAATNSLGICDNVNATVTGGTLTIHGNLDLEPTPVELASGASVARYLAFRVESAPTPRDTYTSSVTLATNETDSNATNNTAGDTTTVSTRADLTVTKTPSANPVQLRQPFLWTITVVNNGPGDAENTLVSDTLPSGMVFYAPGGGVPAPYNASPYTDGVVWSMNDAGSTHGSGTVNGQSLTCAVGTLEAGRTLTITVPVRVTTYAATYSNTATAATDSVDPVSSNNSATATVNVQRSSLAGSMYRDLDNDGAQDAGETTIASPVVNMRLTGTDDYGNAVNVTVNTSSNGSGGYIFNNLSPANGSGYTLTQLSQPLGYWDGKDTPGTSGGTAAAIGSTNISGITLAGNTAATGYLIGELPQNSISGYVYSDLDNDGVKDAGEAGIPGVTMHIEGLSFGPDGTEGTGDDAPLSGTTTTNASGLYTFTPLYAGRYDIVETQPGGYLDGKDSATWPGAGVIQNDMVTGIAQTSFGLSSTNNNFGELVPATLSGYVFVDQDSDAVRDAGETSGAFGVTVALTGTDDLGNPVTASTTSAANGQYAFTNLRPGTYTVTETVPPGLTHTGAQAGTKGGTIDGSPRTFGTGVTGLGVTVISGIPVVPADTATGYNFGESGQGLKGFVYVDLNGNGTKDAGEPGIPGIRVTLSGQTSGGQDVCVAIDPSPCVVTTDSAGAYSYVGLPISGPGGYTLTEQGQGIAPLSNYGDGIDKEGTLGGDATTNDRISSIPLTTGALGLDYNFGEEGGSIGGRVYLDADRSGTYDTGDSGLAGISIALSGTTASGANVCTILPACSFSTTPDGTFTITGLPAGTYTLTETQPADYASATTAAGSGGGTPGPTTITGISVTAGTSVTGYLFGEKTGSLAGHVYLDPNNNGLMDLGETGIAGVSLRLTGTSAGGSVIDVTVTTAADGSYTFDNLPNANGSGYTLTETQPGSYLDGKHTAGSGGGSVTVPNVIGAIPFSAATAFTAYNFGELQAASLSGHVYRDDNNDSVQDPGEALAGVTLTLTGTDDQGTAVNLAMTTAADGTYGFTDLRPSNGTGYTLAETQPTGYGNFTGATGTMVGTVAGTTTGTAALNQTSGILLGSGQSGLDYDFREKASSLSGFVYDDLNNDGVKDSGEPGIANVTVTLSGAGTGTTTTAADGSYRFDGLTSGTYTVTETQPTGYLDGLHAAGSGGGNATVANVISAISLTPGAAITGYNFGEVQAASLSGHVYHDADYDSILDAGEALSGVTLTLTGNDDQGSAVSLTTTTATDGTYTFTGLRPSSAAGYILTETQPANVDDFPGTTGTLVGTIASTTMGTAGINQVTGIVLGSAGSGLNYDFRESTSSLSGFVYVDANDNGLMDGGETGIPGVSITLSGTASATTTTASDGSYAFPGLVSGTYTLTETHPVIYQDGREAAGSPAGTVDNGSFTFAAAQNRISSITLPVATSGTGYLFGERTGLAGSFSGKVWYNSVTRNQTQDSGEPGLAGWRVEVVQGGIVRGSTATASDGTWTVSSLAAASGYEIVFRHPNNNAVYGDPVSQDPSYTDSAPNYAFHTIRNMTLRSGGSVVEQNLPIDPSGVVYDAITRNPVSGATVAISGPGGFDPATHLVGGAANQSQVTDATGFYQFLLLPTAPAGTYTLSVNGPAIYVPGTSSILPPAAGPLDPGAGPGNYAVQAQPSAPTGAQATTYYLTFSLDSASASVVNNHLPVDPVLGGALVVTKTTPKVNVVRGELVPYTITARNTLAATLSNLDVVDEVPPGFKYVSGSAQLDGVKLEPAVSGRTLRWRNLTFTAGQTRTFKLVLVVGSGVGDGEYTNRAWALNNIVNTAVSNIGSATVRIVPDPTFDCTDIIGKVFDDRNANGFQDEGEPGLPNIGLATVKGRLITTDAEGRYHIPCAEVPQMDRGSNFILKLDARTLPSGYRMTTENPRVVRATRGKMVKLNFGATLHRVVRLEISDAAFEGEALRPEWKRQFEDLPRLLEEKPSVVRLVYRYLPPDKQRAKERLDALAAELRKRWKERDDRYPLSIELERVEVTR